MNDEGRIRITMQAIADTACAIDGIESAAIFVGESSGALELAGAAGISGPPLDGLVAAVRNPAHPIAKAMADDGPTYDVFPMNPGGPALRSHLPMRSGDRNVGVLAVAHDLALPSDARAALEALASEAAARQSPRP